MKLKDNDLDEADSYKFALEGLIESLLWKEIARRKYAATVMDDVLHPHDIHAIVTAPPVPFECALANISTQVSLALSYPVPFLASSFLRSSIVHLGTSNPRFMSLAAHAVLFAFNYPFSM